MILLHLHRFYILKLFILEAVGELIGWLVGWSIPQLFVSFFFTFAGGDPLSITANAKQRATDVNFVKAADH